MDRRLQRSCLVSLLGAGIAALGWADWLTGYELNLTVFYFIPVSIAAWFLGLGIAVSLAVFSALAWYISDYKTGHVFSSPFIAVWNTNVRLAAFLAIGWTVFRVRQLLDHERDASRALRRALSEARTLEAFLPICATCKKIRDRQGAWHQIEAYISMHSDTRFSHGYCPECAGRMLRDAGLSGGDGARR